MVRTGSFGRTLRAAPSLTNTLIAIAREMQQQEDQNLMSAWQKGGSVDGKKVTDEMVLKHWRDRLKDISKDDPLADTYRNVVLQYEYSIAESKMTAKYALLAEPTSGDDSKMSAFYLNWAKKVPANSEFYRVLQRDAGQFIRSAKAKQKSITKADEEKKYNAQMGSLEKSNELPGQTVLKIVTLLAQEGGVIGESPLGAETNIANSTNIDTATLPGIDQMLALLNSVDVTTVDGRKGEETATTAANANVLYTGEDGKPVTGADIHALMTKIDPNFHGSFDLNYVRGLVAQQRDGLSKRIALANKTGHVTDMVQLMAQQAKVNEYGREIAAWPVAEEYSTLHAQMQAVVGDPNLLPDAKVARINAIRTAMGALADDKRIAQDTRMQTQLKAEADGKAGIATLAEDLTGTRTGMTADQGTDIAVINDFLETAQMQKDLVADGTHVMTQGNYVKGPDGKTVFQASTGGSQVGAATMEDINNLPGAGKPVPVMVPNGDGGGATPMYVVPAPVLATANGADGGTIGQTNSNPVASFIRYRVNGVETTLYGVTDPTTKQVSWTNDPPWDQSKVKTSFSQNGAMQVDFTAAVPSIKDDEYGKVVDGGVNDLGNGFVIRGAHYASDGTVVPGQLAYDPQGAVTFTDPARVHAGLGKDPYTDSFSASLAALKAVTDGQKLLQQWTGDPRFHDILDQNAHLAAGQTRTVDAQGNAMWTGGNAASYQTNIDTADKDLAYAKTGGDSLSNPALRDAWWRDSTFSTPAASSSYMSGKTKDDMAYSLPSDVISKGGADLQFTALAGAFQKSTMKFMHPELDQNALSIKTNINLTVPGFDMKSITPSPTTVTPGGFTVPTAAPQTVPTSTGGYSTDTSTKTSKYGNVAS